VGPSNPDSSLTGVVVHPTNAPSDDHFAEASVAPRRSERLREKPRPNYACRYPAPGVGDLSPVTGVFRAVSRQHEVLPPLQLVVVAPGEGGRHVTEVPSG
jgi:hypothetical protein